MAQNDMLKRYLDAGIAFTQMTRQRAEGIVKDLVKTGEIQRDQTQERVDELVERSRKNTEQLVEQVRKELSAQLSTLGFATKDDIARLEASIAALRGGARTSPSAPGAAASKEPGPLVTPASAAKKAAPGRLITAPPSAAGAVKKAAPGGLITPPTSAAAAVKKATKAAPAGPISSIAPGMPAKPVAAKKSGAPAGPAKRAGGVKKV